MQEQLTPTKAFSVVQASKARDAPVGYILLFFDAINVGYGFCTKLRRHIFEAFNTMPFLAVNSTVLSSPN